MALCRAQIELGLEIFEVQSELEDSDVVIGSAAPKRWSG